MLLPYRGDPIPLEHLWRQHTSLAFSTTSTLRAANKHTLIEVFEDHPYSVILCVIFHACATLFRQQQLQSAELAFNHRVVSPKKVCLC